MSPKLIALLIATGLSCLAASEETKMSPAAPLEKPNFIMIMSDDQGYGDIGCFGAPSIQATNNHNIFNEEGR
jgi:arylsulfatase